MSQRSAIVPETSARIDAPALARSNFERPRLLLIGTHPSHHFGSRSVGESLAEKLRQRGFKVRITSNRRSRVLRVIDMFFTALFIQRQYDLAMIDVYSGSAFRWAELISRLMIVLRKPMVLALHGGNLPELARNDAPRVGRVLSRAGAITSPSLYLADVVRAMRPDVHVIPNPLAIEDYSFRVRENPTANLIWLRTFHRIYDPLLAVRVLKELATDSLDAKLTMIGPDKDGSLNVVRAEAKRLGVLDRIDFTGGIPKSEVPRYLARGDIFLNTSTIDNTPVSLLEAMAVGLPVVSTSVGGVPHLLDNGRYGLLVPVGDAKAMSSAVKRLITEPGLAGRLSRDARTKAETFRWDGILPQWEQLFLATARHHFATNARFAD